MDGQVGVPLRERDTVEVQKAARAHPPAALPAEGLLLGAAHEAQVGRALTSRRCPIGYRLSPRGAWPSIG